MRVTLKSGSVFDLNRMAANDFDDGVRVWDGSRGIVDLASWAGGIPPPARVRIRTIELIPTAALGTVPGRLHGTVRARRGEFTGFIQWDRQACVTTDEVGGRTAEGSLSVRFETIRSIARRSRDSSLLTLRDGREIALSGTASARATAGSTSTILATVGYWSLGTPSSASTSAPPTAAARAT